MEQEIIDHIDQTLAGLRVIYLQAAERINALKPGQKIAATELSKEVALETTQTGAQIYPLLLQVIRDFPGVDVRRGATGGIYKLAPGESKKIPKARAKKDDSVANDTEIENEIA